MENESAEFFARQVVLPGVGLEGLAKLRAATIAVAGVGGVGSSAAYYLARSGVGRIRLVDQDIVEPSNLPRVHGASQEDLFHSKAEVRSKNAERNPQTSAFSLLHSDFGRSLISCLLSRLRAARGRNDAVHA